MQVDNTLILAAGFGTRMRSLGRLLPKPLLPLYESTVLEIQYALARKYTKGNIFINAHYLKNKVVDYCSTKKMMADVLIEDPILDVGGAIHNVAKNPKICYQGNLLILNADLILFLNQDFIDDALNLLNSSCRSVLWTKQVHRTEGYNMLQLANDKKLESIIKAGSITQEIYPTYSGVSMINLKNLTPSQGPSSFFESVVRPGADMCYGVSADSLEYFDFGTVERFYESVWEMFELMTLKKKSPLISFLRENAFIDMAKINQVSNSYGYSFGSDVLNFSNDTGFYPRGSVVLESNSSTGFPGDLKCIINGKDVEPISSI